MPEEKQRLQLLKCQELDSPLRCFGENRGQDALVQRQEALGTNHFPGAVEDAVVVHLQASFREMKSLKLIANSH